jgi:hypothetical protein
MHHPAFHRYTSSLSLLKIFQASTVHMYNEKSQLSAMTLSFPKAGTKLDAWNKFHGIVVLHYNEMVQGPCAHVGLHDKIDVDFTDLSTVILSLHRLEVIRHQTQHSRLHSYWICTNFRSIARVVTKCALLMDPDELWPLWHWKVGQIKNPGIMSCILIIWIHDKNMELIPSLVQEL